MCVEWAWTGWQQLACVGRRVGVWWWWCMCVMVCGGVTTVSVLLKLRCELFFSTDFHELTFSLDFHDIPPIWFHLVAVAETALSCQLGGNIDLFTNVCVCVCVYIYIYSLLSYTNTARCRPSLTAGCIFLWQSVWCCSEGWKSLTTRY